MKEVTQEQLNDMQKVIEETENMLDKEGGETLGDMLRKMYDNDAFLHTLPIKKHERKN